VTLEDATLVMGALNGDRVAFMTLYDRWARLVRAVCIDTTREWILLSTDLMDEDLAELMHEHIESCRACREILDEARKGHADFRHAVRNIVR